MSTLERTSEGRSVPDDLKRVLELGDSAIAQQFQVSERLDAKARSQVTLAGAWFAVTQAVAAVAYSGSPGHTWLALILLTTFFAGIALFATFFFSYQVWKPRQEKELTHIGFRKLADAARYGDPGLTDELLDYYQHVIGYRRKSNADRVVQLKTAQKVWWAAVGLTFAELLIAVLSRLVE